MTAARTTSQHPPTRMESLHTACIGIAVLAGMAVFVGLTTQRFEVSVIAAVTLIPTLGVAGWVSHRTLLDRTDNR